MNNRQWRRSTAIAAAVVIGMTSACSSPSPGTPTTTPTSPGTATAPAAQPVTLKIPSHLWASGADQQWMQMLADNTTAQFPNVTIDKPVVPFADYFQQAYTQMSAGPSASPDVVVAYDPQVDQWARQGLLEPLDPYLEKAGIDVSKMIAAQQVASIDGHVYGLLGFANPRLLIINKALYDDASVDVPTTPEEWRAAAEKITDKGQGVYGAAFVSGGSSPTDLYQYLMPIVAGFGGKFVTAGKPTATSPEVVQALDFLKGMYDDGLVPSGMGSADIVDAFTAGKIASVVTGPFLVGAAQTNEANKGKEANFTLVKPPFSNPTVSVNLFLALPKASQHKDEAAAFITSVVKPDVVSFVISAKHVPPGVPAQVPADVTANVPWLQQVLDAASTAVSYAPEGAGANADKVMQIIGDQFQNMLVNGASAQDTAQAIQDGLAGVLS